MAMSLFTKDYFWFERGMYDKYTPPDQGMMRDVAMVMSVFILGITCGLRGKLYDRYETYHTQSAKSSRQTSQGNALGSPLASARARVIFVSQDSMISLSFAEHFSFKIFVMR